MSNMEIQNNNDNDNDDENKKKKNTRFLPELRTEILLRLKMKSLHRFKCVSKSWCRLISSPKFARSHFDLAAAPTTRLLCMDRFSPEVLSIDVDQSILRHRTFQLPVHHLHFYLAFEGSCRGFVLIAHYPKLTVWNPLTGVHRTLSCTPFTANVISKSNVFYNPTDLWGGLGYDASNDDYLIVIGWHQKSMTHVEFFSLRTNEWKEIEIVNNDFPYTISSRGSKAGEFLNGAIHWLATKKDNDADVIIALDLVGKKFTEIPLPEGMLHGFFYSLKVLGGCLGVCNGRGERAEIWVMKDYNVESSWTKINNVFLPYDINKSAALCLTKDERVVASNDMGHLVKFSHRGKYAEHQPNCLNHHFIQMMIAYTESLLSLPGDVNEVEEDDSN